MEVDQIPIEGRRRATEGFLLLASERLTVTEVVKRQAKSLEAIGVRPIDALHVASASTSKVDFFATCDDDLLRKTSAASNLDCKVVSLLDLVKEVAR